MITWGCLACAAAPVSPSTWKLGWTQVSGQDHFPDNQRLFPSAFPWDLAAPLLLGAAQGGSGAGREVWCTCLIPAAPD